MGLRLAVQGSAQADPLATQAGVDLAGAGVVEVCLGHDERCQLDCGFGNSVWRMGIRSGGNILACSRAHAGTAAPS